MKNFFLFFIVVTAMSLYSCGNSGNKTGTYMQNDTSGVAEIVFRDYEHDFGKIKEGEKVSYVFIFDNKGTTDLIVRSALTSCGCTVPKYDTKPINPGGNGEMEVVFDSDGKNGIQTKTISVRSNASKPVVILKITADVESSTN